MQLFRRFSRRSFISSLLGIFSLSVKPLQARSESTMLQLREAVRIPVRLVASDWQQHRFDAWVTSEENALDRLFFGVLSRLPVQDQGSSPALEDFLAYCSFCPHEACEVKLVANIDQPLLVCPCHSSEFDPREQGKLLSGPAPRGLYRFEFHREKDDIVITHIESAALALFQA
jgi:Rieske Fe-S protein